MKNNQKIFIIILIPIVMVTSFLLGRISVLEQNLETHPIEIQSVSELRNNNINEPQNDSVSVRASSRGSINITSHGV